MKRLLLAVLLSVSASAAAFAAALPVNLRPVATIEGDTVTLGDLWDNLGDKAETVIANAPQPGKRITADARWLAALAQAHHIDWQPASAFDRIVIERAGQRIDTGRVEDGLRQALGAEGVQGPLELEIINRGTLNLIVPADAPAEIAVRDLSWDPRTNRFAATIEVPAGSPTALRQRVAGRAFTMVRVPVLNRGMSRGDVISHDDIGWQDVRADGVRGDTAIDPRQLIGLEPRRSVRQNAPVRLSEVQRPVLVTRNSIVTMQLITPYMSLTTQGRVSEDGGKGDMVRVTNLQTKRVVEATVDGPGRVTVLPAFGLALAN